MKEVETLTREELLAWLDAHDAHTEGKADEDCPYCKQELRGFAQVSQEQA